MKKLVILLVLSLCVNGMVGIAAPWTQVARAASKTEEKQSNKGKKGKTEKSSSKKKTDKSATDKEKNKKQKKTKVEKEKEYILDLAGNNQVALSVILEYTKMNVKLKDVKSIELENKDSKKDKKLISWEKDPENEGDTIFTVLKDFKEVKLRIKTRKASKLLVLKNGARKGIAADDTGAEEETKSSKEKKSASTQAPAKGKEKENATGGAEEAQGKAEEARGQAAETDGKPAADEQAQKRDEPESREKQTEVAKAEEAVAVDADRAGQPQADESEARAEDADAPDKATESKEASAEQPADTGASAETAPKSSGETGKDIEAPTEGALDTGKETGDFGKDAQAPAGSTETPVESAEVPEGPEEKTAGTTDEPAKADEEPAPAAEESGKTAEEPAQDAEKSGTAAEEPAPAAEESGKTAEEPAQAAEESGKTAEEPAQDAEKSGTAAEEPAKAAEESGKTAEEPAPAAEESGKTAEEPAQAAEKSGTAAEEPAPIAEEAGDTGEEPGKTAEEPGNTDDEPAPVAEEPGETVEKSVTTAEEPDEAVEEPLLIKEKPDETVGEPLTSADEPGELAVELFPSSEDAAEAHLTIADEPGETVEEPLTIAEKPGELDVKPVPSSEEAGEKPVPTAEESGETGEGTGDATEESGGNTGEPEGEDPAAQKGTSIPAEAEAWFKRDAEVLWGTLEQIVAQLTGGETVYIQAEKLLLLREAPLAVLSTVIMLPDGDVFKGSYSVCISTDNPALVSQPALIQPVQLPSLGEVADLYIWVKLNEDPSSEEEEKGGDDEEAALTVTVTGLEPTGWSRTQPQFTLSGIPEDRNWSYAAIIYDERIVPIASNVFAPGEEGVYTVRFAMLNDIGDIMSASEQYTLQLDWTMPEVSIELDEETSYTLIISATDKVSGLDAVSVDGGKTWEPIDEDGYTLTEEAERTFKAGAIQVRDVAGNVYESEEEYTLEAVEGEEEGEEEGEGGYGGGGGGDGTGTPTLPHSSGDGEEGTEYDALALDLPDEPMRQLTVGGEPMALTLMLASAQEPKAPVGSNQPFTARLRTWKDASQSDAPNTLVLEAELADDLGDVFTYEWHFNGEVYRLLANSGIKYLALKVGDAVAAFPTEGFTGGTRYTELKMQGVSTRKFDYTLAMKLNLDPSHVSSMTESDYSQECDLSIHTVVEQTNYELSNSPQSMMYYYNVFLGPEDMLDQPFGEYDANA